MWPGPLACEKDFQGLMMNSKLPWLVAVSGFAFLITLATAPAWAQPATGPATGARAVATNGVPAGVNAAGRTAVSPAAPSWIPLPPKHQQYLDQVLAYWEFKSNQVKRYRCTFRRWEYDPVFGPKATFNTYSEGVIKYSEPDKGLFRVERMSQYEAPRQAGGQPTYLPADQSLFEHWVCDGQWVYHFDHQLKKLVQTQLPPELRGKAIGKGPLPFLFNAKADDIKRRFWLQVITPKGAENEYHLEAVPRTQEDAANFKMIHVIIDKADYLPKAMVVFDLNYRPETPSRTTFEFTKREVNFSVLAEQLNLFHREFFEPAVPNGWAKDVRKWNRPVAPRSSSATASNPNGDQASSR